MQDPKELTLAHLLDHHDRSIRALAYEIMRQLCMTQIEEAQRSITLSQEPSYIRDTFRPLSS